MSTATDKPWYKKPVFIIPIILVVLYLFGPSDASAFAWLMFLFPAFFWLAIIGGLIYFVGKKIGGTFFSGEEKIKIVLGYEHYTLRRNKTLEEIAEKDKRKYRVHIDLWESLGDTKEERTKNIDKLFSDHTKTITVGIWWDFVEQLSGYGSPFIKFQISRSLAVMEAKEREYLKTAFHLYNDEKITMQNWAYCCFAFVNGNGKASIDTWEYYRAMDMVKPHTIYSYSNTNGNYVYFLPNGTDTLKDGDTTVKFYQDHVTGSVDQAVNWLMKQMEQTGDKKYHEKLSGSGVWLGEDDIADSIYVPTTDYVVSLGKIDGTDETLTYSRDGSLITIAPPGAGKTQCLVIPNMLSWKGPAVVLDVKGEIYEATHKWREQNVGPIYKFSPLADGETHNFNPLTFVRQEEDFIWEDSRSLAEILIVPSGTADQFWENKARDVVTAAIAYICFTNEPGERAMSKVLQIVNNIGWDDMVAFLKANVFVDAMKNAGYALDSMDPKQRDSVLQTAQTNLSAWQGPRTARATKKSDWNPLDLRNNNATVYICVNPNEIDGYLSVLRVFISIHIRMLTSKLPDRASAPVLFMLDEMPRLKKMPPIDEALNIGRQYKVKLWMFAQSYGQLKEAYTNAEGLLGSCEVRTFMNIPLNDELATKLSDQLGYRPDSFNNSKVKLVEPIELAGPNYKDLILILGTATKPARIKKQFAYQNEELLQKMGQQ